MGKQNYILITPARNEEKYIELTLKSVISQTMLPLLWVIVNDGSTDRTEDIVSDYEIKYEFIKLLTIKDRSMRDFASQVYACDAGYREIVGFNYDYLGFLDADISIEPLYYETLLLEFESNKMLGVGGGLVINTFDLKTANLRIGSEDRHVAGGVQMFRRKCFESIGGYIPLKEGGQDVVIEVMARMQGWRVKSFPNIKAYHHKADYTDYYSCMKARYHDGIRNNLIGTHPFYHTVRCIRRVFMGAPILGSISSLMGFFYSLLCRDKRQLSDAFVGYLRREQLNILRSYIKILSLRGAR
jgi:poly-beta-1,6-N-acetyl-D-glucosamine synthase